MHFNLFYDFIIIRTIYSIHTMMCDKQWWEIRFENSMSNIRLIKCVVYGADKWPLIICVTYTLMPTVWWLNVDATRVCYERATGPREFCSATLTSAWHDVMLSWYTMQRACRLSMLLAGQDCVTRVPKIDRRPARSDAIIT